jgi:transcriptional regulator with XRE-family HTH domain
MDDLRVGATFRAIRIRRGLRQVDVAGVAGVSPSTVSRLERGHFGSVSIDTMRKVAKVLDVRIDLTARWRAGDLDRLLNARHSNLHELVARMFNDLPEWVMRPEVSFAIYGERGVIDILAWHPRLQMLLVIELKTARRRVAARQPTLHAADEVVDVDDVVATWIIVSDGSTNRRCVQAHQSILRAAFPSDGRSIRGWLRRPVGSIHALSFWADAGTLPRGARLAPPRRVSRARSVAGRSA